MIDPSATAGSRKLRYHSLNRFRKDTQYPIQLRRADAIWRHKNNRIANRSRQHSALAHLHAHFDAHLVCQREMVLFVASVFK